MKMKSILSLCLICASFSLSAQDNIPALDKSPLDVSYYPCNYPLLKAQQKNKEPLMSRVIYSRPHKAGRALFGDLIEYGKIWRLGANEATEIEFFVPVAIGQTKIKKGRYSLFAIPDSAKWTLIINRDTDTWGSFVYDVKKDVARIDLPLTKLNFVAEDFSIFFEPAQKGMNLVIVWDELMASLPIQISNGQ